MKGIDEKIARKFALAAGALMTRVFTTRPATNPRRLMFAAGPATAGDRRAASVPAPKLDVLGLGFIPGREWQGPAEVFVEEMRGGRLRTWTCCRLYAATSEGPIYVLTADPDVCFSFDGNSLVPLAGRPDNVEHGVRLAGELLRAAARRVPDDIEQRPTA